MGSLPIPIGTYHRSESGKDGSIVLNQAIRDKFFDPRTEFAPVSLRSNKLLKEAKKINPVYWIWDKNKIKRISVDFEYSDKRTNIKPGLELSSRQIHSYRLLRIKPSLLSVHSSIQQFSRNCFPLLGWILIFQ